MTEAEQPKQYNLSNEEIVERYLERYSHSRDSVNGRKYGLQYFFQDRYFGYKKHIFEVEKRDLIDYFDYLNHLDTICLNTKVNKWITLRSFLQFVMEYYDELVVVIPKICCNWAPVHRKPDSNTKVIMTKNEVKRILEYTFTWNFLYYILFRLIAETGMRVGELLSINLGDVNIENRYVNVAGKKGRKVYYFSKGLARHLALFIKERELMDIECTALFVSNQKTRFARRSINGYLHAVVARLGIKKRISSHSFRRTLNTIRKRELDCPNEDRKLLLNHKIPGDCNVNNYLILTHSELLELFDRYNPYRYFHF